MVSEPRGADRGNVSLPPRLRSPDVGDDGEPMDADNQPTIVNTQTAMYEVILDDLRWKIERLEARNEKLEGLCELAKNQSGDATAEAEGEIVELNDAIATETKKISEGKKRCEELEEAMREQRSRHEEAVRMLDEKLERARVACFSEIKAINAKVNAIEDFKSRSESLRAKYDSQSRTMEQREEEMQRTLKRIRQKSMEHRENLRKEAYRGTLEVSERYRCELDKTVPKTTQRLMRETIILENELVRLWSDYANAKQEILAHERRMEDWNEKIEEAKATKINHLRSVKLQDLALQKLKRTVIRMKSLEPYQKTKRSELESLKLMDSMRDPKLLRKDYLSRELEVIAHRENVKRNLADELKSRTRSALEKCRETLGSLKGVVDSALFDEKSDTYLRLKDMDLRTFAYHLLDVIEDYDSKKSISDSELLESRSTSTSSGSYESTTTREADREVEKIEAATRASVTSQERQISVDLQSDSLSSQKSDSVGTNVSETSSEIKARKDKENMIITGQRETESEDYEFEEEEYCDYGSQDAYEDFLNYGQE